MAQTVRTGLSEQIKKGQIHNFDLCDAYQNGFDTAGNYKQTHACTRGSNSASESLTQQ